MKRKCALLLLAAATAAGLWLTAAGTRAEVHSRVDPADCLLCGAPNPYRGADALAFVYVRDGQWRLENVGAVQYRRDERRDVVEPLEPVEEWRSVTYFYHRDDRGVGTRGWVTAVRENGLIAASLDVGLRKGPGEAYLASVLCEDCFQRVRPTVRNADFFLADCLTGEVYPLYRWEEPEFQVRDYRFRLQVRSNKALAFYAVWLPPVVRWERQDLGVGCF